MAHADPGPLESKGSLLSRRSLLDILIGSSAVAWLAAVLFPVLRYLTPPADAGGADKLALTDAEQQELHAKGFMVVRLGSERVLVFEAQDGSCKALSARCTHEGCTVQYVPSDALVWCACHNGKFNPDGRVISGPPPRPLQAFVVTREGGSVTISRPGSRT